MANHHRTIQPGVVQIMHESNVSIAHSFEADPTRHKRAVFERILLRSPAVMKLSETGETVQLNGDESVDVLKFMSDVVQDKVKVRTDRREGSFLSEDQPGTVPPPRPRYFDYDQPDDSPGVVY